ncbi:hypothetical protein Glo7428_5226 (plasmid) [Gloeocapsa sp. PCC 7428]|uniref:DUF6753 family protein n=1 Tax=Gloeocapsa sp. PCC 7428 TaxID=1173026 RepID=UPI0002A60013|nr:DUF6753 family protein [Gloeocapsa sp. PCC 7428]AFZ33603.1 hypothetical protein Glo7428_5226 [Gloeocapsa sp. PCC 7428]
MKKLSQKAKEVLDICLAAESPEVKARVYEILEVSELDSSDPMFLVLALTGQMRVLLEAAPADLAKLLHDWRSTSARSLVEIQQAITQVKATQQQQANTLKKTLESVANGYVKGIKEAGMATTSAIAAANSETLSQARLATQSVEELKDEVVALCTSVEADRRTNEDVLKVLLGRIGQTTGGLETASAQINSSHLALKVLQQNITWIKFADWFSPLAALVIVLLIGAGGGWWAMSLKYNDSVNVLGRNLVEWNIERIVKCQKDNNPKCTVWIVPPEERK